MTTPPPPRVRTPATAKPGEIIEIKSLVSHEMESGFRKDADGKLVPRKILNRFEAAFNGKPFFTADWYPSISANPYQAFYFKASVSGEFRFTWRDDDGSVIQYAAPLTVA